MSVYFKAAAIGIVAASAILAETHAVDLARYSAPDGWKREEKARTSVSHIATDEKTKGWCQLYVWLSTNSAGNLDADFAAEWSGLIVGNFGALTPSAIQARQIAGWQGKAATANKNGLTIYLYTYSTGKKRMAFTASTNRPQQYQQAIDAFFASITLAAPETVTSAIPAPTPSNAGKTTNFDDGWVSVEQPDWVRSTKDGVVVLIHYRQPDIRAFNNVHEATAFAWNQLLGSRYKNVANAWFRRSFWSDGDAFSGKYFAQADARDNDGRPVHVALFRGGNGGKWIEIVTPDKATFQSRFTAVQQYDGTNWAPLEKLAVYNKFAVAAADVVGSWESASGAAVQYYEVYTGNNAGMAYASSTISFVFRPDGTYTSVYKGAQNLQNGRGTQFHGETFNGRYSVTNWEMTLTNRFKGETHKFAIQFEAVKGGRILHMYRGNIEDMHMFRKP